MEKARSRETPIVRCVWEGEDYVVTKSAFGALDQFAGLSIQHRDLLVARVPITSYNLHVLGFFFPSPLISLMARLCTGIQLLLLPYSQFFPNSRVIRYIKYRLHFSMFDNFSYAVYSDYFVGWITRRKSRRRMFQL
jgi:hypothetical protein